jgi:LacI family transcriptional regulator
MLLQLTRLGTSLVMIDRDDHASVRCHRVLTDDERVGQLATSHLVDLGRRAIAHIAGPDIQHARRRETGWRDTLRARGIKVPEEWTVRGGFMEADGYRSMKRLLTVRPRIDAVFAANDPVAIGAMKAIWEAGLRVPQDIAVVGVGDIALGDLLRVPLTTVGWSRKDQGRHAAELLLSGLEGESEEPRRIIIPPRLIVRESCGAGQRQ